MQVYGVAETRFRSANLFEEQTEKSKTKGANWIGRMQALFFSSMRGLIVHLNRGFMRSRTALERRHKVKAEG